MKRIACSSCGSPCEVPDDREASKPFVCFHCAATDLGCGICGRVTSPPQSFCELCVLVDRCEYCEKRHGIAIAATHDLTAGVCAYDPVCLACAMRLIEGARTMGSPNPPTYSSRKNILIGKALDALHDIASAYAARRSLYGTHCEPPRKLTPPLRESMEKKAFSDEQIENLALDTWEEIATAMLSSTEGTTTED